MKAIPAILLLTSLLAVPVLPVAQTTPTRLAGTSWQLVKIQSSDDKTYTPDDRGKYTLAFGEDGRLTARIDCNRGSGVWKSAGPNQLEIGPIALTRVACPPTSLHDRVAKDLPFVRTYTMKDGHLFLALLADGGIYEFEPLPPAKSPDIAGRFELR